VFLVHFKDLSNRDYKRIKMSITALWHVFAILICAKTKQISWSKINCLHANRVQHYSSSLYFRYRNRYKKGIKFKKRDLYSIHSYICTKNSLLLFWFKLLSWMRLLL